MAESCKGTEGNRPGRCPDQICDFCFARRADQEGESTWCVGKLLEPNVHKIGNIDYINDLRFCLFADDGVPTQLLTNLTDLRVLAYDLTVYCNNLSLDPTLNQP